MALRTCRRYAWLFAAFALAHPAHAQEQYPPSPVRLVVPQFSTLLQNSAF
jgi:hypothetical protein